MTKEEVRSLKMFKKLEEHIGVEVSYTYIKGEEIMHGKGVLNSVNFFDYIVVNNKSLAFIDYTRAIISISVMGENLYINPYLGKSYYGFIDLDKVRTQMFGESVNKKQETRASKKQTRIKNLTESDKKLAQYLNKQKYIYMAKGLEYIKLTEITKWLEFVDKNMNSLLGEKIVKDGTECLRLLSIGSYQEIEEKLNDQDTKNILISIMLAFSPNAESLDEYIEIGGMNI